MCVLYKCTCLCMYVFPRTRDLSPMRALEKTNKKKTPAEIFFFMVSLLFFPKSGDSSCLIARILPHTPHPSSSSLPCLVSSRLVSSLSRLSASPLAFPRIFAVPFFVTLKTKSAPFVPSAFEK